MTTDPCVSKYSFLKNMDPCLSCSIFSIYESTQLAQPPLKNGINKIRLAIPVVFQMNRKRTCVQPLAKKRISGRNKRNSLICKAWKVLINESEKNNHLLVLIELQCIGGEHVSDRLPKDSGCKPMHLAAALQSLNEAVLKRKLPKKELGFGSAFKLCCVIKFFS